VIIVWSWCSKHHHWCWSCHVDRRRHLGYCLGCSKIWQYKIRHALLTRHRKILKTRLSGDFTSKIYLERDSVAAHEGMRETDVQLGNLEEPPSIPRTHEDESKSRIPRIPAANSPKHRQNLVRVFGRLSYWSRRWCDFLAETYWCIEEWSFWRKWSKVNLQAVRKEFSGCDLLDSWQLELWSVV